MDEKLIISLIAVIAGWSLVQGALVAKWYLGVFRVKRGLLEELDLIDNQLMNHVISYSRNLQIYSLKGFEPRVPLTIKSLYFDHYFKDAFPSLNKQQRMSYQLINSSLEDLNQKVGQLVSFIESTYNEWRMTPDDERTIDAVELWGDKIKNLYATAMDIRWHIEYHKRNPNKPYYKYLTPVHESYLKFKEEVEQEITEIIKGAKSCSRESFENIYNADLFAKTKEND